MKINIYNDKGEVIKTEEAEMIELRFGTIRKIMKLLDIDNAKNSAELLMTVNSAWDEVVKILNRSFEDMTEEDWEGVKLSELLGVLLAIVKYSFKKMAEIPVDEGN